MEQVFAITASASSMLSQRSQPCLESIEKMISVSATFIWQPYVSIYTFFINRPKDTKIMYLWDVKKYIGIIVTALAALLCCSSCNPYRKLEVRDIALK